MQKTVKPATLFQKTLEELTIKNHTPGLKVVYHIGKYYFFSGMQYYDANGIEAATKSINEYLAKIAAAKAADERRLKNGPVG